MSDELRATAVEPGVAPDRDRSVVTETRRRLASLGSYAIDGARQVADESDVLFVGAVRAVDGGLTMASEGLARVGASVGRRISPMRLAARLGLRAELTTRDRLRKLLVAEAKRSPIEVRPEEFDEFVEKMGILFELIFTGVIRIEDIVLEAEEEELEPELDDRQLSLFGPELA